jgi:phospholipase/carboxylesterase
MTTTLSTIERETGPKPTASVIWMHGLGADGNDFVPLVPELDLAGCGALRFVFPNAPHLPVTLNNGYVMPAWYDLLSLDLSRGEDEAGIRRSALAIEGLIAREVARGVAPGRIVLAGFSQGCAMALHTGLRHAQRLAGIMALSGYLPLPGLLAAEKHPANADIPIFMAHGTQDPVVSLAHAQASCNTLTRLGWRVDWHSYPMPHSLHPQEVLDIGRFLRQVLA